MKNEDHFRALERMYQAAPIDDIFVKGRVPLAETAGYRDKGDG
jgi:hypothetical protein